MQLFFHFMYLFMLYAVLCISRILTVYPRQNLSALYFIFMVFLGVKILFIQSIPILLYHSLVVYRQWIVSKNWLKCEFKWLTVQRYSLNGQNILTNFSRFWSFQVSRSCVEGGVMLAIKYTFNRPTWLLYEPLKCMMILLWQIHKQTE